MQPISRETIIDRRQPQLRWSAIFGGAVLSIGVWILLQVLGMGLGLSAVDTDDAGSLKGVGIGTGIWSLIAPLIAMFVGGMLAGRLCGSRDRKVGGMHASVMWALGLAVGLWTMMSLVGALAGGVAKVGGAAMSASSSIVSGAGANVGGVMSTLGIDANDLLGPVNQRLQREGKPPITAEQMNATMRAIAQRGLKQGRLDRQVVVEELARNTALSRADAEDVANDITNRYGDVETRVGEAGEKAKDVALTAADKTGKVLLLGGLMMLLSLASAIAGGMLGTLGLRRDRDRDAGIVTGAPYTTGTVVTPTTTISDS